jgi:hypothetical protein
MPLFPLQVLRKRYRGWNCGKKQAIKSLSHGTSRISFMLLQDV